MLSEIVKSEELLQQFSGLKIIRELVGYNDGEPQWGGRLGIYHPLTGKIVGIPESNESWTVLDSLQDANVDIGLISNKLGQPRERILDTLGYLQDQNLLLIKGSTFKETREFDPASSFTPEVYIQTTEACNLTCHGCAVGTDLQGINQHAVLNMNPRTLETGLVRLTVSFVKQGHKKIKFKWAGGEPMMPKPLKLIHAGQELVSRLCFTYPELDIEQVIITNGTYLTESNLKSLQGRNIKIAVSLWGLGRGNDEARGAIRPQDSYENIVAGIKQLHEMGFDYNINHVVTPDNASKLAQFIRAMWDTKADTYIGRDWNWPNSIPLPIPLGIAFFRAQSQEDIASLQNGGYERMVKGLRQGFEVIHNLIMRGEAVPRLGKIDYLQLFDGVIAAPCGTGYNYIALGPRGVAPCHEALFGMKSNISELLSDTDILSLANTQFIGKEDLLLGQNVIFPKSMDDATRLTLMHSGGTGCPRTSRDENNGQLGYATSIAEQLYAPIVDELLSLETIRRIQEN